MKKQIKTKKAPQAIGPYSQAIISDNLIFCSGQIPLKPDGTKVSGSIEDQTKQVMKNLKAVLEDAGTTFEDIVKTTIYCVDLVDFETINTVYGSYFKDILPARATVQVAALPKGAGVEIEAIALKND